MRMPLRKVWTFKRGDQVMTNPVQPTESERVRAAAKRASRHLEKLSEREQLRVLDVLVALYAPETGHVRRDA